MFPLAFFERGQQILELLLAIGTFGHGFWQLELGMQHWLRLDYVEPENYLPNKISSCTQLLEPPHCTLSHSATITLHITMSEI